MNQREKVSAYLSDLAKLVNTISVDEIVNFITLMKTALAERRTVYVFGNGGSGATASHMVCDFNKGVSYGKPQRMKMICLNDNMPTMLAYANDVSYESCFVEQLKNFLAPGDLVIGISGSGNSPNVIKAIDYANEHGATTIGICGYDGGKLKQKAKHAFHVASFDMQKVEDLHLVLGHITMQILAGDEGHV